MGANNNAHKVWDSQVQDTHNLLKYKNNYMSGHLYYILLVKERCIPSQGHEKNRTCLCIYAVHCIFITKHNWRYKDIKWDNLIKLIYYPTPSDSILHLLLGGGSWRQMFWFLFWFCHVTHFVNSLLCDWSASANKIVLPTTFSMMGSF